MNLAILSDCIHTISPDGKIGTENHVFLHQMEALASKFDQTLLCCPVVRFDGSHLIVNYSLPKIEFMPLKNVGGNTFRDKIKIVQTLPHWWSAFRKADGFADIVYQRFPNNLNIPGFFYFWLRRKKVFATYTGMWKEETLPATYRFQRWLLQNLFRGPVWVYTDNEADTNNRIRRGYSPSYGMNVWNAESDQVSERIARIKKDGLQMLKLITVGALVPSKNQRLILEACAQLKIQNIPFQLTVVGSGPLEQDFRNFIRQNDLQDAVHVVGKQGREELRALFRQHDFVVQAPLIEGFGKVPVEGFFHGLIPVLSNVGVSKELTGSESFGYIFESGNAKSLEDTLKRILTEVEQLPQKIHAGRSFAAQKTLERWSEEHFSTVMDFYGLRPGPGSSEL